MTDAELTQTLESLESVLAREFRALVALDGDALEQTTAQKLALEEALRAAPMPVTGDLRVKSSLERIKHSAQVNQALMVHARACIQGALRLATGAFAEPPCYGPVTSAPSAQLPDGSTPVRVNVRG